MGRLLKFLCLCAVLALGVETYGRYVLKLTPGLKENRVAAVQAKLVEYNPRTGMSYRVNVDQLIDAPSGDFSILYKTNEIGLRDRPMGTHLRQELKLLVFGDEFAEGWGVDIDQTFVVRAQNLVNTKTALKPPVRLVITGKSSYGAAQNYLAAAALIETLQPKAIVFLYSSLMPHADALFLRDAEVVDGLAVGMQAGAAQTARVPHLEDYPPAPPRWIATLATQSVGARMLAEWLAQRAARQHLTLGDPLTDRLAGIRSEGVDLQAVHAPSLRHVRALATLAASKEIPFMLVHMPLPPQITAEAWAVGRQLFDAPPGLLPSNDVAVVDAFCNEAKLRCVSLHRVLQEAASKLRSTRLFYPAELAMTSDGAAVVGRWFADEIYRWLGELGFRS